MASLQDMLAWGTTGRAGGPSTALRPSSSYDPAVQVPEVFAGLRTRKRKEAARSTIMLGSVGID